MGLMSLLQYEKLSASPYAWQKSATCCLHHVLEVSEETAGQAEQKYLSWITTDMDLSYEVILFQHLELEQTFRLLQVLGEHRACRNLALLVIGSITWCWTFHYHFTAPSVTPVPCWFQGITISVKLVHNLFCKFSPLFWNSSFSSMSVQSVPRGYLHNLHRISLYSFLQIH